MKFVSIILDVRQHSVSCGTTACSVSFSISVKYSPQLAYKDLIPYYVSHTCGKKEGPSASLAHHTSKTELTCAYRSFCKKY